MSTRFGHVDDLPTAGPVSSSDLNSRAKSLASQTLQPGSAAGVFPWPDADAFLVEEDTDLDVSIAPGTANIYDSAIGTVRAAKAVATTLTVPDDSTSYVHATIEDATNKTYESGLPLFVTDDLDAIDGGLVLAEVTTVAGAITSVVDLRRMITPLVNRGAYVATMPYYANDVVSSGGSVWVALQDSTGQTPAENSYWTSFSGSSGSNGSVLSFDVTGQTTITVTNSQSGRRSYYLYGVLSNDVNFVVPAFVTEWFITNATSGAHTVTVKTAAGTGIVVDQGAHRLLATDGTNVVAAITQSDLPATSVSTTGTQTLTNKRITKRTGTATSSATPTINTDNVDYYSLTAQAVDITSFTTNLSGTPVDGQTLWISIKGTAARAITWGASFEASTVALPTTTVSTDRLDVGFIWNPATSKWRCVAVA